MQICYSKGSFFQLKHTIVLGLVQNTNYVIFKNVEIFKKIHLCSKGIFLMEYWKYIICPNGILKIN
jgi:hypothetical protein